VSTEPRRRGGGAALVAAGILLSRVFGLVRARLLGRFLGTGDAMDAFTAAFRIPNLLQNLFGEGVLSASFIPVYARLLAEGRKEEAGRLAGAVGTLLAFASTVVVLGGILLAPVVIPFIAPGFSGDKRILTILLVQIAFPGVGLLVLSAWALGVLNSHGRFFLSYASPVAMNIVMIAALLWFGPDVAKSTAGSAHLATMVAWASVLGSGAQLAIQLPTVRSVAREIRAGTRTSDPDVRTVLGNFVPVFIARGVLQISAFVDGMIASMPLLSTGAVAILGYAQIISMLPVSLFGMSVAASELPVMSGALGSDERVATLLRGRLNDGLHRVAFYVVPSAMAMLVLGDVVGGLLYQTGRFARADTIWLWQVLGGSAVGLLAGTLGRLYSSAWYALRNTRTPLQFAVVRVILTTSLGYICALWLPGWIGVDPRWGVAGLTGSAGVAAWVEYFLLRRSIIARIGHVSVGSRHLLTLWSCAALAAATAFGVKLLLGGERPLVTGLVALPTYGLCYFAATAALGVPEVQRVRGRLSRLIGHA
jgi:putative peptidoglycan lipid II flippase